MDVKFNDNKLTILGKINSFYFKSDKKRQSEKISRISVIINILLSLLSFLYLSKTKQGGLVTGEITLVLKCFQFKKITSGFLL